MTTQSDNYRNAMSGGLEECGGSEKTRTGDFSERVREYLRPYLTTGGLTPAPRLSKRTLDIFSYLPKLEDVIPWR